MNKVMTNVVAALVTGALLLASCAANQADHAADADVAGEYRRAAEEFVAGYLAWRPATGTSLGLHEYDGKVTDFSAASIDAELARLRRARQQIGDIEPRALPPRDAIERRALLAAIDGELFSFEVMDALRRNPMSYASAFDLTIYAKRNFAPKPDRLRSTVAILQRVPASLDTARANLAPRLPRTYVKTAIEQANGSAAFFVEDLATAFQDVHDDSLQAEFKTAREAASEAMRAFVKWLQTERMPQATDDFAVGRDAYARMLRQTELIEQSPEQILEIGLRELKREQERFAAAARQIDPAKPAVQVYRDIQHDHPTEQSLIPDTIKHLDQIRQFLLDRRLISFPSMVPVKVDLTPKFERASSFASMDSPGPFETRATEAFYYVTPVEPEWDAKRKEEWLTAFNYYTTDVVSIHEAYPGHYVQALHLKASPASRVDKVFGSYAFGEGWAHYCEQMVLDEGFPPSSLNADALAAAKYRLAQSGEALLRLCRLCAAVKMHCQGMSVDEGTRFFMDNCYYEEAPARAEAERGTYDPGYGFYTIGKLQVLKLREDYRRQEGANFSLLKFHDELLKYGQPPIRLLREIMLKDEKTWDATME